MKQFLVFLIFISIPCILIAQSVREKTVILKIKNDFKFSNASKGFGNEKVSQIFSAIQLISIERKFKSTKNNKYQRSALPKSEIDITTFYELHYKSEIDEFKVAVMLNSTGVFEYVEPALINHTFGIPDDPLINKQWHLNNIFAFDGWDIDTGGADIVVGITDTGIDWDHPDLIDAISYNEDDPIDGIDNDQNGYIDDYRGWNFFDDNNDPNETSWSHGTHVSGLVGASTNNGVGVAGVGYSTKVLPVKCGSFEQLSYGYEGVVYAVQNGARIVNCSWGSTSYTQFGHDIVKWATDTGALIVCGAGNNNNEADFYPASFFESLSVGGTDSSNAKWIGSTYNYNVDITAPAEKIYSTKNPDVGFYNYETGTSMASPIVAGAAALVAHRFPSLNNWQIKAQLCERSTDVYQFFDNDSLYSNRMGRGMLHVRKALDTLAENAIEVVDYILTDGEDDLFLNGDEFSLGIELLNIMQPASNVSMELTSMNPNVAVKDGYRFFASVGTMSRVDIFDNPFKLKVIGVGAINEKALLNVHIKSGGYERNYILRPVINPDYVNIKVNDIASTVSSNGLVGYNSFQRLYGLGFEIDTFGNALYECGLMIGHKTSKSTRVADRVRGENGYDHDYWPSKYIIPTESLGKEAFRAKGTFTDSSAIADEIGLKIRQQAVAYDMEGHRNYFIISYTIENVSDEDLNEVYVGMYADWDIDNAAENRGDAFVSKRLAYVENANSPKLIAGIQSLNGDIPVHLYSIDNMHYGNGGVDISTDGFSTHEKYLTLTNNRLEEQGGESGTDVSQVVGCGPVNIQSGDSVKIAFAVLGVKSIDSLISTADSAYKMWNGYVPGANLTEPFRLKSMYPNPTTEDLLLSFDLKKYTAIKFSLFNRVGSLVANLGSKNMYSGANLLRIQLPNLSSGVYFLYMNSDEFHEVLPFTFLNSAQ